MQRGRSLPDTPVAAGALVRQPTDRHPTNAPTWYQWAWVALPRRTAGGAVGRLGVPVSVLRCVENNVPVFVPEVEAHGTVGQHTEHTTGGPVLVSEGEAHRTVVQHIE